MRTECRAVNYVCHCVSVRIPERVSGMQKTPPAVVVYVHRARTNWLVLNLLGTPSTGLQMVLL